jgi:hypothetical protein
VAALAGAVMGNWLMSGVAVAVGFGLAAVCVALALDSVYNVRAQIQAHRPLVVRPAASRHGAGRGVFRGRCATASRGWRAARATS